MSDVEHAVGRRDGEADGGRERPLTIGLAELSAIPFFRGLPSWALEYLAERAEEQVLPTGQTILHQYDRVGRVYFLVSGSLQILIRVGSSSSPPMSSGTSSGGKPRWHTRCSAGWPRASPTASRMPAISWPHRPHKHDGDRSEPTRR